MYASSYQLMFGLLSPASSHIQYLVCVSEALVMFILCTQFRLLALQSSSVSSGLVSCCNNPSSAIVQIFTLPSQHLWPQRMLVHAPPPSPGCSAVTCLSAATLLSCLAKKEVCFCRVYCRTNTGGTQNNKQMRSVEHHALLWISG